jgi:hypothetical protein
VSLQELEDAVSQLPVEELTAFARWFEEYLADAWDRRIEADIQAGRLTRLVAAPTPILRQGVASLYEPFHHPCVLGPLPSLARRNTRIGG